MVGLTLIAMTFRLCYRYKNCKGFYRMKQLEEKFKRKMKYWRVSYLQASGRDRLSLGMFMVLVLVYMWWFSLVY